jgi:hypothetical protein
MIASSLREGDEVVDLLLGKDADATMKSELSTTRPSLRGAFILSITLISRL